MKRCGNKGQALLELALVGSFLLLILGGILGYGLSAQYSQQAKMKTFRNALAIASRPDQGTGLDSANVYDYGAGSSLSVSDRHVPDPTQPFAIGSFTPVVATASVVKDVRMDHEPNPPRLMFEARLGTARHIEQEVDANSMENPGWQIGKDERTERTRELQTTTVKEETPKGIITRDLVDWVEYHEEDFRYPGGTLKQPRVANEHSQAEWCTPHPGVSVAEACP